MHVTRKRACVGRNLGGTAEYLRPFWDGDFFMLKAARKQRLKEMKHVYMWNYFQNCFHRATAQMCKSEAFTNCTAKVRKNKSVTAYRRTRTLRNKIYQAIRALQK